MALIASFPLGISLLVTSKGRDSLSLVVTQVHQMQDERTVSRSINDDILQMPRDAFTAPTVISNDSESHKNAGSEIRGSAASSTYEANDLLDMRSERPARRLHGRAAGRGLPARIEYVDLQGH